MIRNIIYGVFGLGSVGMLFFSAPSGSLLTGTPETGKVTTDKTGKRTIRGGPAFIWLGGGYAGGK